MTNEHNGLLNGAAIESLERLLAEGEWPAVMAFVESESTWVLGNDPGDPHDVLMMRDAPSQRVRRARAQLIAQMPKVLRLALDEVKHLRACLAVPPDVGAPLRLARPLAVLDIEGTTGDPETARLIELAVVKLHPDGGRTRERWLVNPGVAIPGESTAIHGITDDDVRLCDHFALVAQSVAAELEGCDLGGYALRDYDLPLLRHEFERAGVPWPCEGARVFDAMHLFKTRERRDLSTALRWYTGRSHAGAHRAAADAEATLDVIVAQLERYPDLPRDLAALDMLTGGRQDDWASSDGSLRWNAEGDVVIAFGSRNVGLRLIDADTGLLHWIRSKRFSADVHALCDAVFRGERPRAPGAPPLDPPHVVRPRFRRGRDDEGRDDEGRDDEGRDDEGRDDEGRDDEGAAVQSTDSTTTTSGDDIPF